MNNCNRSILRLALPSILANITIPLVGIVDVAIIGHISSAVAVGGIAVGTMLFDLLYWNFGFLRVGTSGLTAQAFGRGNQREQCQLLVQSIGTALVATAFIWLIQWFFIEAVLWCMPCSPEVAEFAKQYFYIRIWAAPATLSLMAFKGWFIGMQNTVAPMLTDIVVNVVNMAASYYLAVYTPLGALGVACGTLIAQYCGLAVANATLTLHYREVLRSTTIKDSLLWKEMKRLFVTNGNLFLRSLCFMVIYVGYTSLMSKYGDEELAVSAILMKLFMLFSYFIDGFAYAAEALVGKDGAATNGSKHWHKNETVRLTVKTLFVWACGLGIACSLFYGCCSHLLVELMTSDAILQTVAEQYTIFLALMPFISSLAFLYDGVFVGAAMAVEVRNCMIWAAVAFVLVYVATAQWLGPTAIYLAYLAHLLIRTAYLAWAWIKIPSSYQQLT